MFWRQLVAEAQARDEGKPEAAAGRDFVADIQRGFTGSWSGYERDRLWLNPDGDAPRWFDAAYALGLDLDDDGRAALPLDVDGDGDLDLAVLSLQGLRLFENTLPPRNFARLRLRATRGDAHAIGAVVRLTAGGVARRDHVRIAEGFLTQVPLDLHFGLGNAARVDAVEVAWPSGAKQTWTSLPAGKLLTLTEGRPEAEVSDLAAWPRETRPRPAAWSADIALEAIRGGTERLAAPGKPLLLNFWSPSCEPCKRELPDLAGLARRYGGDVRFAGASLELRDLAAVADTLRDFDVPYPQYFASEELLRRFFGPEGRAVLPSTFVFDATGRLRRAFLRPVSAAEIAALLDSFRDEGTFAVDLGLRGRLAHAAGKLDEAAEWLEKAVAARPDGPWERCEYGAVLAALGRFPEALAQYEAAIRLDPAWSPEMWASHGNLLRHLGKPEEALASLDRALKAWPEHEAAQVGRAGALLELGRTADALAAADGAARAHPRSAAAHLWRGAALLKAGRKAEAAAALRTALEFDPKNAEAAALLERAK